MILSGESRYSSEPGEMKGREGCGHVLVIEGNNSTNEARPWGWDREEREGERRVVRMERVGKKEVKEKRKGKRMRLGRRIA